MASTYWHVLVIVLTFVKNKIFKINGQSKHKMNNKNNNNDITINNNKQKKEKEGIQFDMMSEKQ